MSSIGRPSTSPPAITSTAGCGSLPPHSSTIASPYAPALKAYIDRTLASFGNAQSAADAVAPIIEAPTAAQPPFRLQTSAWARDFAGTKLADADGSAVQNLMATWVGLS
ncbi:hypothetical protein [Kitasatospora sp. NBC_00070]|uniref:hypothetical protein n=1 Tax=Kitasatospora sp. NBC_00070 TaxID=2975962 RepID=UPI0038600F47